MALGSRSDLGSDVACALVAGSRKADWNHTREGETMAAWKLMDGDRIITIVYGSYEKAVEMAENYPPEVPLDIVPSI